MHFRECLKTSFFGVVVGLFFGFVLGWVSTSALGLLIGPIAPGPALAMGLWFSVTAIAIGAIPALTYGALAYACLLYWKRANLLTALAAGLAPGLAFFIADTLDLAAAPALGGHGWWLFYGAVVSAATHIAVRHGRV